MNLKDIYFASDGDRYFAGMTSPFQIVECGFWEPYKTAVPSFDGLYGGFFTNIYPNELLPKMEECKKLALQAFILEHLRYYTNQSAPEVDRLSDLGLIVDIPEWILGLNPATGRKCIFSTCANVSLVVNEDDGGCVSFSGERLTPWLLKTAEEFYWGNC